ncbi:hypothetical protein OG883_33565 [Streptomyces sp. NBC_01142]|uniref:hypothetical protein n=1 Tax=Streptomyces sp. NBC_01142 TaxID=2975865 RepID=UPI0022512057|nr:hypothetical protein [Streptomyces sp. NBC_01142]MCX4824700.1 hypothetical protein [Streptomyces sp. NBC_01142]
MRHGWIRRVAGLAAVTAGLLVAGCSPDEVRTSDGGSATPSVSLSPTAAPPASASPVASPSKATPSSAAPSRTSAAPAARPAQPRPQPKPQPKPTVLSMHASTAAGGRVDLVRGGAAQEFTVAVRNGNTRAYSALLVVFQMEMMESAGGATPPQNGFVLERRDPVTGAWRAVELRVANDVQPHYLFSGGTPLAKDVPRTERYRIRAGSAGAEGSMPLMIRLVDTAAPESASDGRGVPARTSLMVTAR